jgi:hypothetical protein
MMITCHQVVVMYSATQCCSSVTQWWGTKCVRAAEPGVRSPEFETTTLPMRPQRWRHSWTPGCPFLKSFTQLALGRGVHLTYSI